MTPITIPIREEAPAVPSWRLLETGYGPGHFNMALDEAIISLHSPRHNNWPILRLYGWNPPCLSIGYFQSVEKDIDVKACQQAGVELVRRPTGGRTLLHDEEITYSLVIPQTNPLASGSVIESYRKISEGLVAGLKRLGIAAKPAEPNVKRRGNLRSSACFASPSPYEITVEGKKLIGSAQLRRRGMILQHGSILLNLDEAKLFSLLRFRHGEDSAKALKSFGQHATSLKELLDRELTLAEVSKAMEQGFQEALGIRLIERCTTPAEKLLAQRLASEKYATEDWNLRRKCPPQLSKFRDLASV